MELARCFHITIATIIIIIISSSPSSSPSSLSRTSSSSSLCRNENGNCHHYNYYDRHHHHPFRIISTTSPLHYIVIDPIFKHMPLDVLIIIICKNKSIVGGVDLCAIQESFSEKLNPVAKVRKGEVLNSNPQNSNALNYNSLHCAAP